MIVLRVFCVVPQSCRISTTIAIELSLETAKLMATLQGTPLIFFIVRAVFPHSEACAVTSLL